VATAFHYHACIICRGRYGDACATRQHNGKCNACLSGITSTYAYTLQPVPCCRRSSRPVVTEEIARYKLAGPGPWFICGTCRRTHSYNPSKEST
jgi:hypothetical protein